GGSEKVTGKDVPTIDMSKQPAAGRMSPGGDYGAVAVAADSHHVDKTKTIQIFVNVVNIRKKLERVAVLTNVDAIVTKRETDEESGQVVITYAVVNSKSFQIKGVKMSLPDMLLGELLGGR